MLLIDRVVAWDAQHAVVAATPRADAWYAEHGAMPSWIGLELRAQAVAAHVGRVGRSHGKPPQAGVLLGRRQYGGKQGRLTCAVVRLSATRMALREQART